MGLIRVICFVRPHRLEAVKSAIAALGVNGMSVGDARGRGNSPERPGWSGGEGHVVAMPIRARLEAVVPAEALEAVLAAAIEGARTGEPGDGKVFVLPVVDAIRIRTGERGETAV